MILAQLERGRGVDALPQPAILKAAFKQREPPCYLLCEPHACLQSISG